MPHVAFTQSQAVESAIRFGSIKVSSKDQVPEAALKSHRQPINRETNIRSITPADSTATNTENSEGAISCETISYSVWTPLAAMSQSAQVGSAIRLLIVFVNCVTSVLLKLYALTNMNRFPLQN